MKGIYGVIISKRHYKDVFMNIVGSYIKDGTLCNKQSKSSKNTLFRDIILTGYFFLALYQPPICAIETKYIVMAINIISFLFLSVSKGKITVPKKIIAVIMGFSPFLLYFFLVQIMHTGMNSSYANIYLSSLKTNLLMFLYFFILILALVQICACLKLNYHDIIKYVYISGLLQFICVLLSFLVPSVKSFFLSSILTYSHDDTVINAVKKGELYRCFGFANNLFDAFGYILSIVISLILLEGVSCKKPKLVFVAIAMLFMPLINARTGLVLAFVGFLIISIYYLSPKMIVVIAIALPILVVVTSKVFSYLPETTSRWIIKGVEETTAFMNEKSSTGVYSEILGKDLVFPDNLFIGSGAGPETIANYIGIDSGYIQCLWRYGIIGSLLLFFGYINMFSLSFFKIKSRQYRCSISFIAGIFFVYLIKLFSISNYGSAVLVFGIPSIILIQKNVKRGIQVV